MTDPIEKFFARYPAGVQEISRSLRALVRSAMPGAHEVLVAKHNHIGYGLSTSMGDRIVYICPMEEYVRLGFNWGGQLPDPDRLLQGEGKRLRHIKVRTVAESQRTAVNRLVREAWKQKQRGTQNA